MVRKCPVCRSREWHKQPSSGLLICGEGHILQNYRNETNEREKQAGFQANQRWSKKLKQKRPGVQDEIVYYGPQARYLFLETLQLILRMQISFLVKEWVLPPEFELICRDIWSLHLNSLRRPPQPEPYLGLQVGIDVEGDGEQAGTRVDSPPGSDVQNELRNLFRDMSGSESSGDEDPDSDSDPDPDGIAAANTRHSGRRIAHNRDDIPAGNIAVLMLACCLCRIPVMYIDFIRVIEAYRLPYLEAVRLLPEELSIHLTQASKNNLSPSDPPSVSGLHEVTFRLAKRVWTKNGIHATEMNAGWVLWRIVLRMGGDATVYRMTKMMAMELNLPLTLNPRSAPELIRKRGANGRGMTSDNLPVEVSLMAALILVLKLKYDFVINASDERGEEGRVLDTEDQGDMIFLSRGKQVAMNELNDEEMDGYLDFCERALLALRKEDKSEVIILYILLLTIALGADWRF